MGERRTTIAELQADTTELTQAREAAGLAGTAPQARPTSSTEGEAQRDVLNRLVITDLLEEAAQREGVQVSEGEIDTLDRELEQFVGSQRLQQELLNIAVPPTDRREFMRFQALQVALGRKLAPGEGAQAQQAQQQAVQERLVQAAREVPVEVNPRYGRWVPEELRIEGAVSGGLSRLASDLRAG